MNDSKPRMSRHNGRSGKNGVYNPKHNDRSFDVNNVEHLDSSRLGMNMYWDYQNGLHKRDPEYQDEYPSFPQTELSYYESNYRNYVDGQNTRNVKGGHSGRNRGVEDLLTDRRTCPEETIFQIGKEGGAVNAEELSGIFTEYSTEFEKRFGSNVHMLDWALHMDETTPHIHERHVFDVVNRYGEREPKQEKALEALGIPLPQPDRKPGKFNNRKMSFDALCREMLFDICKQHGIEIERNAIYGGKQNREKNDYIIEKQNQEIKELKHDLSELREKYKTGSDTVSRQTEKIRRVESILNSGNSLLERLSSEAYDIAVTTVTESAVAQVQKENERILGSVREKATAPERKLKPDVSRIITMCFDKAIEKLRTAAQQLSEKVLAALHRDEVRKDNIARIRSNLRPSLINELRLFSKTVPQKHSPAREHDRIHPDYAR